MTYSTVLTALHGVLAQVAPEIPVLLAYEPTALHDFPTFYTLLDRVERSTAVGRRVMRYHILGRLCFRWMDNEQAELETLPYVNAVPLTLDQHAGLDGALQDGIAQVTDLRAVFISVGGTVYRALDFSIDILEKEPREGGTL